MMFLDLVSFNRRMSCCRLCKELLKVKLLLILVLILSAEDAIALVVEDFVCKWNCISFNVNDLTVLNQLDKHLLSEVPFLDL